MNRQIRRRLRTIEARGPVGQQVAQKPARELFYRFATTSPRVLLLGTALASTFLFTAITAPRTADAASTCTEGGVNIPVGSPGFPAPPGQIFLFERETLECRNEDRRIAVTGTPDPFAAISLETYYQPSTPVTLYNSGALTANSANYVFAQGIVVTTLFANSPIKITNKGDIEVLNTRAAQGYAWGIDASAVDPNSPVEITNYGTINVRARNRAIGISASPNDDGNSITIKNHGDIDAVSAGPANGFAAGIFAYTGYYGTNSVIGITNNAAIKVKTTGVGSYAAGIDARTRRSNGPITITNNGKVDVRTTDDFGLANGIQAKTTARNSSIEIDNSGDMWIETKGVGSDVEGIDAYTQSQGSDIVIRNSGSIAVRTFGNGARPKGISAGANGPGSLVDIDNSGEIFVESRDDGAPSDGIDADSYNKNSVIRIRNSGNIVVNAFGENTGVDGIDASTRGPRSRIWIENSGSLHILSTGYDDPTSGIDARTSGNGSPIWIANSGELFVKTKGETIGTENSNAVGIDVYSRGRNSHIEVSNGGDIRAEATGKRSQAFGILAETENDNSSIQIENSGSIFAAGRLSTGISASSLVTNPTTIVNSGEIGAESYRAIDVKGVGTARIFNSGTITGFVDLTDQRDRFFNQAGGVFETKMTSFFGDGDDAFINRTGGTIQTATNASRREMSSFEDLETFKNRGGTISLVDNGIGDKFTIANEHNAANLRFEGGGFLAVDAELGGPGSKTDNFIVDGNVSGQTKVVVNDLGPAVGVLNTEDIKAVFVEGNTPSENNFVLANGPIDKGFFSYDLFFTPTGSGF